MSPLATGYLVTGLASLGLVAWAWRSPRTARWPFALLFGGAAAFNAWTALRTPQAYVDGFAPHAFWPVRELLLHVVSRAPRAFVLPVAAGQLAAAVGLAYGRGRPLALGACGAGAFLFAISGLGVGAAFPTNLVLMAGVLLLRRRAGRPPPVAAQVRRP